MPRGKPRGTARGGIQGGMPSWSQGGGPCPALEREAGRARGGRGELGVVSQGKTIEEAQVNLKEAVELYIESFGVEDIPESKGEVVFYPLEIAVSG